MAENTLIDGKPATRRHLLLYDEDYEFIKRTYGEYPGVSAAIRILLHEAIKRVHLRAMEQAGAAPVVVDGLDEILGESPNV